MEVINVLTDERYSRNLTQARLSRRGVDDIRILYDLLLEGKLSVSTAESCSGGLVASKLNDVDGASSYFIGGVCTYTNEAKVNILHVREETIREHGVVSMETVLEMAEGAMSHVFGSDIAVSTSGYIGKDGGDEFADNGIVCICAMCKDMAFVRRLEMPPTNDRKVKKRLVVDAVIEMLLALVWTLGVRK